MAGQNVILCRGASEKDDTEDKYVQLFTNRGYTCNILTALCFEFVNTDILEECLLSPHLYAGLILTSKRAAEAVLLACKESPHVLKLWRNVPTFCVGPASESFIKEQLGFDYCLGSDTGNAEELSKLIVQHFKEKSDNRMLLYPCNEIARETIQKKLQDCDIDIKKIISYKPFVSETLENDLLKLLSHASNILVFFSPSIVENILKVYKKGLIHFDTIKAVAIGPVTEKCLLEHNIHVYATAQKPEPQSLLQAILEAEKMEGIEQGDM